MPEPTPPPPLSRIVLIHGAWQGAWAWDALLPELRARGLEPLALELPGNGHHPIPPEAVREADYHACVRAAVEAADGPVALIGHSGGGMLVTAAAEAMPERIGLAIWLAGMLLPDGTGFDSVQREIAPETGMFGVTPHIRTDPGGLTCSVPPEAAIRHFYHDCPPQVARAAAARLTPQPLAGHRMRTPTTPGRFGRVPKLYIEATQDRSVLPQAQRLMQALVPGLPIRSLATGHAPQLVAPAVVADIIAEACLVPPRA